ncbi:hypothetical protein CIT292_08694 [Citrobacter youngae ATCC 29220]|uniref:Heterokaryon incompatibility domain-containing protein n=1 Tax=Citrobacter youngae ATCC 29220 TaxID=500640 RepID=D4BDX5_9ENTR|nr:hypothetical protein CIT292_08694 [Citrobacter youngae ATCC 29220]
MEYLPPVWLHLLIPVDMDDFIHQTSDPLVKRRDQYIQYFWVDVACLTDTSPDHSLLYCVIGSGVIFP